MIKKISLSLLLASFSCFSSHAQENFIRCGSSFPHIEKDKAIFPSGSVFEAELSKIIAHQRTQRTQKTNAKYRIPVIVHIIHNGENEGKGTNISKEQVYSQIEVLNEDFKRLNTDASQTLTQFKGVAGAIDIEFVLAQVDEEGLPMKTPGIVRHHGGKTEWSMDVFNQVVKPNTIWNPEKYLNFWVANFSNGLLGYAQFPSMSGLDGLYDDEGYAQTDGVAMRYNAFGSYNKAKVEQLTKAPYNLGRTTTHELGHFFGLLHLWGDGGCSSTDYCNDTPTAESSNFGCKTSTSSCGNISMVQNYMDYSDDACMNLFTQNQIERIEAVLQKSPRRKELLTSDAGNPLTKGIYSVFSSDKPKVCKDGKIRFINKSFGIEGEKIQSYFWEFEGGTPATSTEANPTITYTKTGTFNVKLTVKNANYSHSKIKSQAVEVVNVESISTNIDKDFEDLDLFSGGYAAEEGWEVASTGSGNYAAVLRNFNDDYRGQTISMYSPAFSIQNKKTFLLRFDVAYALRQSNTDSLKVSYSTDCGGTYTTIYLKGGADLATKVSETFFIPSASEWRKEGIYIDLKDKSSDYLFLKFENIAGYGSNIYIDNIVLQEPTSIALPTASMETDRKVALPDEFIKFYSTVTEYPHTLNWIFAGAKESSSSQVSPLIRYAQTGIYTVILNAINPKGTFEKKEVDFIQVINGKRIHNVKNTLSNRLDSHDEFVAGTNKHGDKEKAELITSINTNYELYAVDLDLAYIEALTQDAQLTIKIYDVAANKPNQVIASAQYPVSKIQRDFNNRRLTRIVLDSPLKNLPSQLFISVVVNENTKISIKTSWEKEATGYELLANGTWQSYNTLSANGGREMPLAHGIYGVFKTDDITGIDDAQANPFLLYPNPTADIFYIESEKTPIQNVVIFDALGKEILRHDADQSNPMRLGIHTQAWTQGMYFVRIITPQGAWFKRVEVLK